MVVVVVVLSVVDSKVPMLNKQLLPALAVHLVRVVRVHLALRHSRLHLLLVDLVRMPSRRVNRHSLLVVWGQQLLSLLQVQELVALGLDLALDLVSSLQRLNLLPNNLRLP